MTIHLDTSALVDALTGPRRSLDRLTGLVEEGHRLAVSTLVLHEWLRGPRTRRDLTALEDLVPRTAAAVFGAAEAHLAAHLSRSLARARGREIDLAIEACALTAGAALWTLTGQTSRTSRTCGSSEHPTRLGARQ